MIDPRHSNAAFTGSCTGYPGIAQICILVACLAMGMSAGVAHAEIDARSQAMGGAHTAAARGLSAPAWNPANLAFSPGTGVRLASVLVDIHNNSLSLARYNEVSGQVLSESDKQRLLSDIPSTGLRLDAGVSAGAIGLHAGRFALTTSAIATGRGNLDRDVFDLVLFGNRPDQTFHFDDTWGEGHAIGKVALSWGQPIYDGPAGRLAVGMSAAYLIGFFSMQVEEARGSLATEMTAISGEAYLSALTAQDGSGFGVDLGAAWLAPGGWSFGLAIDNAMSHLTWNGTVERTEYRLTARDINLLNDDLDSGFADSDSTYAVSGHTTSLPRNLRLGAARESGRWLLAADYVQGLNDGAGTSTTPRLNVGAEWRPLRWLSPRSGLSLGGSMGVGLAGGFGIQLGFWQMDLAVLHRGGFSGGSTRGAGFGFSTQLVF